jgi:hypothetical protein
MTTSARQQGEGLLGAPVADRTSTRDRAKQELYTASQWKLMRMKFRKHKLAQAALAVLGLLYLVAALCELVAPYATDRVFSTHLFAPPTPIKFFVKVDGQTRYVGPYVNGLTGAVDENFNRIFEIAEEELFPFASGCVATNTGFGASGAQIVICLALKIRVTSFSLAPTAWGAMSFLV